MTRHKVVYDNYAVINDYTCDIDKPSDVELFEKIIKLEVCENE